jgi:superfamily II RNA helicase
MRALARGASVLVAAPTGTGKTVVAEFGVFLAHRAGLRSIYTTPIKALSNQKFRDFKTIYGDEAGLLTGDVVVNPGGSVLVMTTEVLRNMLVQREDRLEDVGVIVFDEVHYLSDRERGTAWEEAILLAPRGLPLVCLSATVPNVGEVASWLREVRGDLELVVHEQRAVPLEHRYYLDGKAELVVDAHGPRRKSFRVGGELARRYRAGYPGDGGDGREARPQPEPWEIVHYLERRELTPAIYFLFSRRACEQAAESCLALDRLPEGEALAQEAKLRLAELPPADRSLRQVGLLLRLLPHGVAVHHAGLLPVIKMLVEELFAAGRLRAVFATDTLALGINMPARTVVIGEMSKWDGESHRLLLPNEYRQMTGRAGRRGMDERGVSVILYSPWTSFEQAMEVVQGRLVPLESAFAPHYSTAANLWHGPGDRDLLADLYERSFRRFQHGSLLSDLLAEQAQLEQAFEARSGRSARDRSAWQLGRELGRLDRELAEARRRSSREARILVDGLARIMEHHGYLSGDRPTSKIELLRHIFDTNALTLAELLGRGELDGLRPAELAEVASWFSYDREGPLRSLPLERRMQRLHQDVLGLNGAVIVEERRLGLAISQPINEDFRGVALAWADGAELGEIADRARLAEGDLVGLLQKTLDLLGQLRAAVERRPPRHRPGRRPAGSDDPEAANQALLQKLRAADALLRRGVVEASYRWALSGAPALPDEGQVDLESGWDLSVARPERPRRSGPPFRRSGPARGLGRGPAGRQRTEGGEDDSRASGQHQDRRDEDRPFEPRGPRRPSGRGPRHGPPRPRTGQPPRGRRRR